jgi:hypothetical protein
MELDKYHEAQPQLVVLNAYSIQQDFYVYSPDTYEEDDRRRIEYMIRSSSPPPEMSTIISNSQERSLEKHSLIIVAIQNIAPVGKVGYVAKTSAIVNFYEKGGLPTNVKNMQARWWDNPEKGLIARDKSKSYIKMKDIAPGTTEELAIVSKLEDARLMYAYNDESHKFDCLRKKEFKLGRGEYYAEIQLAVKNYISPPPIWLKLWHDQDTKLHCKLEKPEWAE